MNDIRFGFNVGFILGTVFGYCTATVLRWIFVNPHDELAKLKKQCGEQE